MVVKSHTLEATTKVWAGSYSSGEGPPVTTRSDRGSQTVTELSKELWMVISGISGFDN